VRKAHAYIVKPRRYSADAHLAPQRPAYDGSDMAELDLLIAQRSEVPRGELAPPVKREAPGDVLRRLARAERF
jgi:hypothetical protein